MELNGFLKQIDPFLRPHYGALIGCLKLRGESSLRELTSELKMSYTGLQPHCERLCKLGLLERKRRIPEQSGRPTLSYRLTTKAELLFPTEATQTLLEMLSEAATLFGSTAPERILMQHFKARQEKFFRSVSRGKSIAERATRLADALRQQGHWCECAFHSESGFHITEYHHPLKPLFMHYPTARRLEIQTLEKLLGTRIRLIEQNGIATYHLGTLGSAS